MNSYFYAAASLASEAAKISEIITNQIVEKTREVGSKG
jgi:hypothetical protein